MFNTTKALLVLVIAIVSLIVIISGYLLMPNHSGAPMGIAMVTLIVGGLITGWVYDTPAPY